MTTDTKADLFEELYSLSKKQEEAIDNSDFDSLTALIGEKQKVINKIDLLNVQDVVDKTTHATDDLRDLQKKIMTVDERNRNKLMDMADMLNKKISLIKTEKRQMKSLYVDMGDRGNYLDKRG